MIRYILLAWRARFRKGTSLFLLSLLGVALGVASVLSIQIINENSLAAFTGSLAAISGEADLSVLGKTPVLPESVYPTVLGTPGVGAAWPLYRIQVARSGTQEFFLQIIGVDFFAPVRFPVREQSEDPAAALSLPGWAALTPALASELGKSVGDTLHVNSGTRRAVLTVGALVDLQKISPLASRKMVLMDISQAQSLLGQPGEVHQIDMQIAEGSTLRDVERSLRERLGPSAQVLTPEQREKRAAALLGAFRLNLTALSLISLFVGVFLVHTSTQASLIRRRPEFGLLRSLGATRGQVFGLIFGEIAILGILGTAAGLPLGYWAARSQLEVVSATLSNLYLLQEIETLRISTRLYFLAGAVGLGGALLGGLGPALDLTRRDTRGLLLPFTLHERVSVLAWPLAGLGAVVLLGTAAWYFLLGQSWRGGGFVLGLALLLGMPLFTPLLIQTLCGRIRTRDFGPRYGIQGLAARLHTTSFAVAALAVAVSMLFGVTLLIGSFRRTVETWVDASVQADIYVTTQSWARAGREAALEDSVIRALTAHPAVRVHDRLRQFDTYLGERRIVLSGIDLGLPEETVRFPMLEGDQAVALRRVAREGAVVISEPLSRKEGLHEGDRLRLFTEQGPVDLPIAGVYYDYTTEGGAAAMDLGTLERLFGPGPINNVSLYLYAGRDAESVADELKALFADLPLEIRSQKRLRQEILAIFDQTFAVTRLLQLMGLLTAVAGITLTLLILARERVAELALYRALGSDRRQIFGVFVWEGLGIGGFGLVLGLVGGFGLALILVFVINRAYFGWTIRLHWPVVALASQALTILLAAVLASIYPAIRASGVPAAELSREDV